MDSQDHKVALVAKVIEDGKVLLVKLEMLAVLALEVTVASYCLFVYSLLYFFLTKHVRSCPFNSLISCTFIKLPIFWDIIICLLVNLTNTVKCKP